MAAYYIASEALTNATKHARATVVNLDLEPEDAGIELTIPDDGVGGAVLGHGSGLIGVRDRVEALGGTVEIDSPAGEGTSLLVRIAFLGPVGAPGTSIS